MFFDYESGSNLDRIQLDRLLGTVNIENYCHHRSLTYKSFNRTAMRNYLN